MDVALLSGKLDVITTRYSELTELAKCEPLPFKCGIGLTRPADTTGVYFFAIMLRRCILELHACKEAAVSHISLQTSGVIGMAIERERVLALQNHVSLGVHAALNLHAWRNTRPRVIPACMYMKGVACTPVM